ncbi:MAG TPA: TadE/TadG family type IV pilus assembly protein [Verrucomicrobiae bacterium]|nr:TadE/TadG family type IV pilus assembly protein [Verrucomicrobiae bacterium]
MIKLLRGVRRKGFGVSRGGERGQSLVELALSLPVLLLLMIGIIEGAALVKDHMTLGNAVREGARAAALGRSTGAITNRIATVASPLAITAPNGSFSLQWSTNNGTTWYAWPSDVTSPSSGQSINGVPSGGMIRVDASSRHSSLTGFIPYMTKSISRFAVLRREPN